MKKKFSMPTSINSPLPTNLAGECKKATKILNAFMDPGQGIDIMIPSSILDKAHGLAIFTVLKAGFLFSGRAGSGLVVARLPDGSWSAPSAIMTGGMGAGGQIGAELTDFVLVLNNKEAVKTFSKFGNVTLGGNISVAAGPIGRNAEASGSATYKHVAAIYSYSKTRGLFAGVSLEGSVIITRSDANKKFYGQEVTAKELLNGTIPPPVEADALYRALDAKFRNLGNTGTMYQRTVSNETALYKNTSISARGTLRVPGARPPTGGYGAPNVGPPLTQYQSLPNPAYQNNNSPTPAYNAAPDYNNNNNNTTYNNNYHQSTPPPVRPPPIPPQSHKPQKARALYDYAGAQAGDLSFREGDIITVTEKSDSSEDWWTGKVNGQSGVFPANYVEML
ncbi:DUF500-domain-containing protein [Backusella circina FSU 941]|nr:DUF500-domain-containing protein [Backusella circina FSU 941]